jgi:hypothetical protein
MIDRRMLVAISAAELRLLWRARKQRSLSVELMTTDHITAEQKAASPFFPVLGKGGGSLG